MEAYSQDRGGREAPLIARVQLTSNGSHVLLMTSPNSYQYTHVETGRLLHRTLNPDFQVGSHAHTQMVIILVANIGAYQALSFT